MTKRRKVVVVLGATGSVGKNVIRFLSPFVDIRAASRRATLKSQSGITAYQLDLSDEAALRRCCDGCDMLVNCAAPGIEAEEKVAHIACELGIDYVDPGGDEQLYAALASQTAAGQSCILSAGMLPGLSGVLPRLLAAEFDSLTHLTGYVLSHEPFSYGGAKDFLASLDNGFGITGLSLQNDQLQPCSSPGKRLLPLACTSAQALPYMSSEWQRLSRSLRVSEAAWFNLYPHGELFDWLGDVRSNLSLVEGLASETRRIEKLVALSVADFASLPTQHVLAIEASGWRDGAQRTRSLVVCAQQGAELTGAVTAFTALQRLQDLLPDRLHFAADVLSPESLMVFLRENLPSLRILQLDDSLFQQDEGAI